MSLFDDDLIPEAASLNIKLFTALFVMMPAHYLYVEICDLIQVYLDAPKRGVNIETTFLMKS